MYKEYDKLPFSIIILKGSSLKIEYYNEEFSNIFKVGYNMIGKNIEQIEDFNIINNSLTKCFVHKLCKNLKKINIIDKYFDIIIKYNNNKLIVFTYEVSNYVDKEIKVKKDREKFLSISTEMKTKCDIIESIRNIEKEHLMHLRDVVNNISEGIVVLDKYGEFSFCNKSALKITGFSIEEMKNYKEMKKYIDIIKEDDSDDNSKDIKSLIVKIKDDKINQCKYIDVSYNHVTNNKNKLMYTVVSLKDITVMKNNEIMMKNQNKELEKITKMKDEFFNMISHELRTPLTIIHSSLQLANDIYCDEITLNIGKILIKISENCSRLLKLINNTLDISKAEAGFLQLNYSVFDIVFVTENIVSSVNFYAKSKGINLVFDTNEEEKFVKLDKDKYEKIILNLLSNAIKFTPDEKEIMVITHINDEEISIKVKDEGIGIPKEKINNIFDRFAQVNNSLSRNSEGTGLGLALVKEFVELMKGKIEVKSKVGEGTEFSIKFNNNIIANNYDGDSINTQENIDNKVNIEFSDIE
nr:ATP-binding protein [Clostridium ganghwense]